MRRSEIRIRSGPPLAMALLALAALCAGCGEKTTSAGGGIPAMPVQVRVAQSVRIPETTEYLSVLKSRQSAAINPQVEGQITAIFVKSGDSVSKGAPLLQIDPVKQEATLSGQEAARAAQDAAVRLAKVNLERAQKLFAAGVISKQDLDNAESAYDSAAAQLKAQSDQVEQQKVELHYYKVSAPADGIVGDIPVHVGDRVQVTTLLTTVDLPGALEAYIYVPADRAKALKVGLPVRLLDENGNTVSETHITFVSPQVETDTQTVLAKAAVENAKDKLRIAQQVRAQVTWGSHDGVVIPVLSVQRINGQSFVFVAVNEGKGPVARQKLLKLGDTIGNDYAVLDGLKAGDHLIVSGTQFLQDGAPVAEQIQPSANSSDDQSAAAH
ncbi:MAG TPA: efflux RND transporter periplasmic adaptor subunit [Candidatus Methylomirabilis sp.]|nr:efflux RND transporter periplasmic adaptor subunit [Candidatus Methylomirabilis sp.]